MGARHWDTKRQFCEALAPILQSALTPPPTPASGGGNRCSVGGKPTVRTCRVTSQNEPKLFHTASHDRKTRKNLELMPLLLPPLKLLLLVITERRQPRTLLPRRAPRPQPRPRPPPAPRRRRRRGCPCGAWTSSRAFGASPTSWTTAGKAAHAHERLTRVGRTPPGGRERGRERERESRAGGRMRDNDQKLVRRSVGAGGGACRGGEGEDAIS